MYVCCDDYFEIIYLFTCLSPSTGLWARQQGALKGVGPQLTHRTLAKNLLFSKYCASYIKSHNVSPEVPQAVSNRDK